MKIDLYRAVKILFVAAGATLASVPVALFFYVPAAGFLFSVALALGIFSYTLHLVETFE
jgi:hypothetical protein